MSKISSNVTFGAISPLPLVEPTPEPVRRQEFWWVDVGSGVGIEPAWVGFADDEIEFVHTTGSELNERDCLIRMVAAISPPAEEAA